MMSVVRKNISFFVKVDRPYFLGMKKMLCTEKTEEKTEIDVKRILDENDKLLLTVKEYEDKYKRALAECENTRIRMNKQIEDAKIYGIKKFCKDIIDVADVLTTATESVKSDDIKENNQLKQMYEGLKMTETQMLSVLGKHGVQRIKPAIGEKFNPNFHEAVFRMPIPKDKETSELEGTIAALNKVGYKLKDMTLRPAIVGVYQ